MQRRNERRASVMRGQKRVLKGVHARLPTGYAMDARERAYHGIDIGKNLFHGHDKRGAIMLRQNRSRGQAWLANLPPCLIS